MENENASELDELRLARAELAKAKERIQELEDRCREWEDLKKMPPCSRSPCWSMPHYHCPECGDATTSLLKCVKHVDDD